MTSPSAPGAPDAASTSAGAPPASAPPGAGRALVLATVALTTCFYAWSLLGPLGPDVQEAAGLTDVQLSAVVAIPVLLGSLMRIPFGIVTDRFGGRAMFTGVLAFTLLPLIALALFHDSFAALAVLGLFLGIAGASFAIGVPFVNGWFPPARQGYALGIYGAGMGGTVLAGLTAPTLAKEFGLEAPFLVAAGLIALVGVIFFLGARDSVPRKEPTSFAVSLTPFRTDGRSWALTLFYFLAFGGFVAMFLYLPKLLTGVHDLEKADAGARAAGFALLAVIGRPTGGALADRIGADRVLALSFGGTCVLALGLAVGYESMVPLTVCCLGMAAFLGLGMGATFKLVAEWFPNYVGGVTGVVSAAGGLGGFFPPLLLGILKSATGGYAVGFLLLAALAASCFIVLAWIRAHPATTAVAAT